MDRPHRDCRQDFQLHGGRADRAGPGGKRVIVASSRGGLYAPGMPFEANDFQEKYLRAVFAFLGIGDIEIIRAEGLALSPAHREAALNTAHATIPTTVAATKARHAA